ncbi:MAG: hypothetical protein L0221_12030 [Chloroflexi bacterium]|nr:hypothetical protein [Chloroflexota bacterium]
MRRSALAVRREFPQVYRNPNDPTKTVGRRWVFPVAEVERWIGELHALPAPPSAVVRSLPGVYAVWALSAAVPADGAATELLRGLAAAVGGEADEIGDASIPLPGTRVENQDPRVTAVSWLDAGRVYSMSEIAALAAGRKGRRLVS